ncbi:MAG TPA: glutamate 5-kinase [Clostridiaceae bacterium]|nr:glutamate 5-kinase [Clostridiaceae bacterium]
MNRLALADAKRVVIKVGTSSLTYENGRMNLANLDRLCRAIADQMNRDREMILVSSGAIAIGKSRLNVIDHDATVQEQQAYAAVGQTDLMNAYSRGFSEYGYSVAQLLLTRDDVDDPLTLHNITNTFEELIHRRVVPIINENDTVSTKEVYHNGTFGDNDALSAIVAKIVEADLLILLSDIDGLYNCDPRQNANACLISDVSKLTPDIVRGAGGTGSRRGTGGMISKLSAATIAMNAGIDMIISNGSRPDEIARILNGESIGTLFKAQEMKQHPVTRYML